MPLAASTIANDVDNLYVFLVSISALSFFIVVKWGIIEVYDRYTNQTHYVLMPPVITLA